MRIYFAAFIVSWLCVLPSVHAEIRFDDGNQHTITEEIVDEIVVIDDETSVVHEGLIRGKLEGVLHEPLVEIKVDSELIVNGGRIEVPKDAVHIEIHAKKRSRFAVEDGSVKVTGVEVTDSDLEIAGGSLSTAWDADAYEGGLRVTDGTVNVSGGRIITDGGSFISDGMFLQGGSRATLAGGGIDSKNVHIARGLIALDQAEVTLSGSQLSASGEDADGFWLVDQAVMTLSEGTITANAFDGGRGLGGFLKDEAVFRMIDGEIVVASKERGDGLTLRENSTAEIHGGRISIDYGSAGNLFAVDGQAKLAVSGGNFEADRPMDANLTLFYATDSATATISGGSYSSTHDPSLGIHAEDQAEITIIGSEFNYPTLLPITDTEGTITGTLLDGNDFSWTFQRDATATILLVPEPSTWLMLAMALPLLGMVRKCFRR